MHLSNDGKQKSIKYLEAKIDDWHNYSSYAMSIYSSKIYSIYYIHLFGHRLIYVYVISQSPMVVVRCAPPHGVFQFSKVVKEYSMFCTYHIERWIENAFKIYFCRYSSPVSCQFDIIPYFTI